MGSFQGNSDFIFVFQCALRKVHFFTMCLTLDVPVCPNGSYNNIVLTFLEGKKKVWLYPRRVPLLCDELSVCFEDILDPTEPKYSSLQLQAQDFLTFL